VRQHGCKNGIKKERIKFYHARTKKHEKWKYISRNKAPIPSAYGRNIFGEVEKLNRRKFFQLSFLGRGNDSYNYSNGNNKLGFPAGKCVMNEYDARVMVNQLINIDAKIDNIKNAHGEVSERDPINRWFDIVVVSGPFAGVIIRRHFFLLNQLP
jgi:hypothetical protein